MEKAAMESVTQEEFYARLYADNRDIMPTTEAPDRTYWRVQRSRELWGISMPGWRDSGDPNVPKTYALKAQPGR